MTTFRCHFNMDSAAFHDPNGSYGDEASEILLGLSLQVQTAKTGGVIRDVNGNTIGRWSIR